MISYSKPYYFLFSFPLAFWGYTTDSPFAIILAEVFFALLCIYSDYTKGPRYISFITIYSAFTLIYCYGNFSVVKSLGTPEEYIYDYYLVPEYIAQALFFTYAGHVFCVLGYNWYQEKYKSLPGVFPVINIPVQKNTVRYLALLLTAVNIMAMLGLVPFGILSPFLIGFLFFLIRYAVRNDEQWLLSLCVVNTFILSINGLLYTYLRMNIIAPGISFLIAAFFGKEQVSVLFKKAVLPIYILLVVAVLFFPFLGQIRTTSYGYDKLNKVLDKVEEDEREEDPFDLYAPKEERFDARVSNINQTSQVVKLVNEKGNYKGSTMFYLSYAFIPRFIWKDKPLIAQGVWFALEIGQAYVHDGGKANNSINMTSPGELYLNFGLIGVVIGMFLIGVLCSYMWQISGFSGNANNLLGAMFGLYLFYLATSTFGIDLQFFVTLISYFCMFQVVNYIYISFFQQPPHRHA